MTSLRSVKTQDLIFILFLLAVVLAAVWDAREWEIKARLFPWVIGIPLLVMLAVQLIMTASRPAPRPKPDEHGEVDSATFRRRARAFVLWILGFALSVWLLGYLIGATVATLAYLLLQAKENWKIAAGVSAGTFAVIWVMQNVLFTPFPKPLLLELLGIEL